MFLNTNARYECIDEIIFELNKNKNLKKKYKNLF